MPGIARTRIVLSVVLVLAAAGAAAPAQVKEPGCGHVSLGPEPPSPPPRYITEERQAALSADSSAWREARSGVLSGWRIVWDELLGTPWRIFGPGIQLISPAAGPAEVETESRLFISRLEALLGVRASDLVLAKCVQAGGLWYVIFRQTRNGVIHEEGRVDLRFDASGRLVMLGGHIHPVREDREPDAIPALSPDEAALAAFQDIIRREDLRGIERAPDFRLVDAALRVTATGAPSDPVELLAWRIRFHATEPPLAWVAFVDARTGDVLRAWNDIRHAPQGPGASGSVNGVVHNALPPQSAPVSTPLAGAEVVVGGQVLHTGPAGTFSTSTGTGTLAVSSWLRGWWVRCQNSGGSTAAFAGSVPAGGNLVIGWTDANSTVAERDVYFFTTTAHDWLKALSPSDPTMDFQMIANCNVPTSVIGSCNAFYDPVANNINLITSGGGCVNMGTVESVVTHEYGHGVSTLHYAPFSVPGHIGEGLADVQAAFLSNSSLIGLGFQGAGTIIRNVNNTCQYPSSCGSEIHLRGLVIGGAFWSTRVQLETAMGTTAGRTHIAQIYLNGQNAAPQDESSWALEALLLDDNDGNLANGTPHVAAFYNGFTVAHGIPFPLAPVDILHTPVKNNQGPYPYEVRARAVPVFQPALNIGASRVFYRVNAGSWLNLPVTAVAGVPNTYRAAIPVQAAGARIEYYFRFIDSANAIVTSPPGAPAAVHAFGNYRETPVFTTTFEANNGSFAHAMLAGQDDWQWGIQYGTSASDPPSAYSGTKCWGNDLGATGWNGNYASSVSNYLVSPSINAVGLSNLRLRYRRWLTVEDATYDQAKILVGATPIWQNPVGSGSTHFLDTAWTLHELTISPWADNTIFTVRFDLVSDAGLEFGGWNIDDLSVVTVATTPILQGATTAAVGAPYTLTLNGPPGGGLLLLIDFATSPVYVNGAGTIALALSSGLIPALSTAVNGVLFPPNGQLAVNVTIPAILQGQTLHLQAVVYPLNDLSNITLSNLLSIQIP